MLSPINPPFAFRPELEGLRGVAAGIVLLSHVSNESGLWHNYFGFGGGQIGVMLFFVLSGQLMGARYFDQTFDRRRFKRYVVHRVARVLPLFYAACIVGLLSSSFGMPLYPLISKELLQTLLLIKAPGILWTIPVEMQFYILFIGVWLFGSRFRGGSLVLCCSVIAASYLLQLNDATWGKWMPFFAPFFFAGILASRFRPRTESPIAWSAAFLFSGIILIVLFPNVYRALLGEGRSLVGTDPMQVWQDPLYLACAVAFTVSSLNAPLGKLVLANRCMTYLGKISYSIYLMHYPVIILIKPWISIKELPLPFLLVAGVATIVLSSMTFFLIEKPAREFINKLGTQEVSRAHETSHVTF